MKKLLLQSAPTAASGTKGGSSGSPIIDCKGRAVAFNAGSNSERELELKLEDSINSIHEEMMILRNREEEARRLNETTASMMGSLSILSFLVCMGVAGLQLLHLKTFSREKIL